VKGRGGPYSWCDDGTIISRYLVFPASPVHAVLPLQRKRVLGTREMMKSVVLWKIKFPMLDEDVPGQDKFGAVRRDEVLRVGGFCISPSRDFCFQNFMAV
jgi:hypothetical protein